MIVKWKINNVGKKLAGKMSSGDQKQQMDKIERSDVKVEIICSDSVYTSIHSVLFFYFNNEAFTLVMISKAVLY